MTRVMWLTQKGMFYAAPQVMRTPLFRTGMHVGMFKVGGGRHGQLLSGPRSGVAWMRGTCLFTSF